MEDKNVLACEQFIAGAHRYLHWAIQRAADMTDLGLHDDLQLIELELERLQVDLLRGRGRHRSILRVPAYLKEAPRDDGRPAS